MDYKQWMDLFGKAADDPGIRDAVARARIAKPLKIGNDELSVIADVPEQGMTVVFSDESVLRPEKGVVGRPILSGVLMSIQHPTRPNLYKGPLPYKLTKETSQVTARSRFGPPAETDEDLRWDLWMIDGMQLTVNYTKDLKSIRSVSVKLAGSA